MRYSTEGVIKCFSECEWHIKSEGMRSGLRASGDSGKKIKSLNIKETEFQIVTILFQSVVRFNACNCSL